METTGVFGSIPQVETAIKTSKSSQDAEQLRTDFLKLLTAQLQFQDPLEPEKNTDFTSQMAQFSGLNEQQKSNELLQKLLTSQNVSQMNQAVTYIGKVAVVEGSKMDLASGAGMVRFDMPQEGDVTINLFDQAGQLLKSLSETGVDKGQQNIAINDPTLKDGTYRFTVSMLDAEGTPVAIPTLEAGLVKSVSNSTSGVTLNVNGRSVNLADVRQVEQP